MEENPHPGIPAGLAEWHFLSRTTFGPSPQDLETAKQFGVARFLDQQLHPGRIDDSDVDKRIGALPTLAMSPAELMEDFPAPKQGNNLEARQERFRERPRGESNPAGVAMTAGTGMSPSMEAGGPRRHSDGACPRTILARGLQPAATSGSHGSVLDEPFQYLCRQGSGQVAADFLRARYDPAPRSGKFPELLAATAQSPAMLFYLDNWLSVAPNAAPGTRFLTGLRRQTGATLSTSEMKATGQRPQNERRGLNENYARELMELHTLGVDGGYTQQDVREVARCFTGWTIDRPRQGGGFIFRPRFHDDGEKTVLGRKDSRRRAGWKTECKCSSFWRPILPPRISFLLNSAATSSPMILPLPSLTAPPTPSPSPRAIFPRSCGPS